MDLQQDVDSLFALDIPSHDNGEVGEVVQPDVNGGFLSATRNYVKCSLGGQEAFGCTALTLPVGHPSHGERVVWCVRDMFYNLDHGQTELHCWLRLIRCTQNILRIHCWLCSCSNCVELARFNFDQEALWMGQQHGEPYWCACSRVYRISKNDAEYRSGHDYG